MLKRITILCGLLLLLQSPVSFGRSVEFLRDYYLAVHGGLENGDFYNAGLQAMTVNGPGDSSLLMFHLGLGLDASYAHLSEDAHHLRIIPTAEATFWFLFLQAGIGPSIDLHDTGKTGADFMLTFGLRFFLGDEYQRPSISVGGRLDWLVGDRNEFVPGVFVRISFWINGD
ncbi:MAG: hypothetical protein JRJ87_03630 [Deltaproteobacteria bacterium]|nr:hypothetical protein [Deltaproteobacteria bacterium]